jgi:L-fuculose-phosphate aldolase
MVDYGLRAYKSGFVTETEGNISVRMGKDRVLVTPTHIPYEQRTPDDMVEVDLEGKTLAGSRKPTSEFRMHLAIYKAREDVGAIVHAHPLYGSVLAVMGEPLKPILDEMIPYVGGQILVTGFAPSGSQDLANKVVEALGKKSAAFIANHGSVCTGKNLSRAFQLTKYTEKWSQIYLLALGAGTPRLVPEERQAQQLQYYEYMKSMDW